MEARKLHGWTTGAIIYDVELELEKMTSPVSRPYGVYLVFCVTPWRIARPLSGILCDPDSSSPVKRCVLMQTALLFVQFRFHGRMSYFELIPLSMVRFLSNYMLVDVFFFKTLCVLIIVAMVMAMMMMVSLDDVYMQWLDLHRHAVPSVPLSIDVICI